MAGKKKISECYKSPTFKKQDKDGYNDAVDYAQQRVEEVVNNIYNDNFPTDGKCSKRYDCFTGCTPLYIPDQNKEMNLHYIRSVIEGIFMEGRMFGFMEGRYYERETNQEKAD